MPYRNAIRPTTIKAKDTRFFFYKHFGAVSSFPDTFDTDAGLQDPDQDEENRPTACTAYLVTDMGTDQDHVLYSTDYQLYKTFEAMNVPSTNEGADVRAAFKVAVGFGLLPRGLEPKGLQKLTQSQATHPARWTPENDQEAVKKPAYLPIAKGQSRDWFDAIKSAVVLGNQVNEKRPVGMATRWSSDFITPLLPLNPTNLFWGHAYKVRGWKPEYPDCLWLKTWEGRERFMHRTLVNKLMNEWGSFSATLQDLPTGTVDELKNKNATLIELILALYQNILRIKQ